MGIEPTLFGPSFWGTMHYVALGAPNVLDTTHQKNYATFYNLIPYIIPCGSCGTHFAEVLNANPITNYLTSSDLLFTWTVKVHNIVNIQLGKTEISVEDAKKIWMSKSQIDINKNNSLTNNIPNNNNNNNNNYTDIIIKIIVLLFVLGLGIYIGSILFTKQNKKR